MATPEHCLYCFDSLATKLDKSLTPLSLTDVQSSYAAYLTHLKESQPPPSSSSSSAASPTKKIPALTRLARLADASSSSSSLESGTSSSTSLSTNTAATSTTSTTRERVTDPDARYPLFVTWDIKASPSSSDWHLRGCIGTFSAESPLSECLAEYAIISALHDTRFHPVSTAELPDLKCAVTLLTNFEDCEHWDDWVVGEHGIKIKFKAKGRSYSGTYLPSVAAEQEWTKEETMLSLMRKAGWRGSGDQWREVANDPSMQVERYRGDKEEVDFTEYKQWREWVNENSDKA